MEPPASLVPLVGPPKVQIQLNRACKEGCLSQCVALVKEGKADVNGAVKGFQPLHFACLKGHLHLTAWLLR